MDLNVTRPLKKKRYQIRARSVYDRQQCGVRYGFSLIELIVVLAVATILTGLLLPAMSKLRENVNRVVCSSNMRQVGMGVSMFVDDHNDRLPGSVNLIDRHNGPWRPQELMAVHHGEGSDGWDGLGRIFALGYCTAPQCFYCPSHRGDHPIERYSEQWQNPGGRPIYINYHYAGNKYWESGLNRLWHQPDQLVIATDGLRTVDDFNHETGMNVLYGDASVRWTNRVGEIVDMLPDGPTSEEEYNSIWRRIQSPDVWD